MTVSEQVSVACDNPAVFHRTGRAACVQCAGFDFSKGYDHLQDGALLPQVPPPIC
jgi:hypothetical protein